MPPVAPHPNPPVRERENLIQHQHHPVIARLLCSAVIHHPHVKLMADVRQDHLRAANRFSFNAITVF